MQQPDEVRLNREEGEVLIARLERNALTSEDRRVLVPLGYILSSDGERV